MRYSNEEKQKWLRERVEKGIITARYTLLLAMFDQKQTPSNTLSNKKCWTNITQHRWPSGRTMLDRARLER